MKLTELGALRRALVVLLFGVPAVLQAATISTLFNTGVSETGEILEAEQVDPHYTISFSPDPNAPGPEAYTLRAGFPVPPWLPEGPASRWIGPQADQSVGNEVGIFTFVTTFDLTGLDPTTARITGQLSADNDVVSVRLNGVDVGVTASGFNAWMQFTITPESMAFIDGVNTLEFDLSNAGDIINPAGLRVEMTGRATSPADLPSILIQPLGGDILAGGSLSLSVSAEGAAPLNFQWFKNGTAIGGATEASYTVTEAGTDASGTYTVKVSNELGEVTSSEAVVRVVEPFPGIFNTGVDDSKVVLEDYLEDTHYKLVANPNDPTVTVPVVQDSFFFPIVDGPWLANNDQSKWIGPSGSTDLAAGGEYIYQLDLDLTGLDPTTAFLSGKWASDNAGTLYLNGADTGFKSPGFGTFSTFNITEGFISGTNKLEFRIANDTVGYTGLRVESLVGSAEPQTGEVLAPRIVLQPRDITRVITEQAELSVVADGEPPFAYQWFKNGSAIEGATESTLSFSRLLPGDEGNYTVVVTNTHGTATSSAGLVTLIEPQEIGIFDTGVDGSGVPIPLGEADPHYILITNPDANFPGRTAFAAAGAPIPPWIANTEASLWITPRASGTETAPGTYTYRLIFEVLEEDLATATISGGVATDDSGTVLLNGTPVEGFSSGGFGGLTQLIIPEGSAFVAGLNALDFVVANGGAAANPTGLRVENLVITGVTIPDEPPTLTASATGGQLRIAWEADATGFVLQETSALPGGWTDSSATTTVNGNTREALIPLDGNAKFFRLVSQP